MTTLNKVFHLTDAHTTVKRELIAALTTFVSLSYILFVNPNLLHAAGMPKGAAFTVTAIATAIGCFIMGLVANYPVALAPTLGSGAFFAYNVCVGMHIKWQTALAAVLVASILFILITVFKLRKKSSRCYSTRFKICNFCRNRLIYCLYWPAKWEVDRKQ